MGERVFRRHGVRRTERIEAKCLFLQGISSFEEEKTHTCQDKYDLQRVVHHSTQVQNIYTSPGQNSSAFVG